MSEPARAVKIRLGDVMVAQKVITAEQLAQALEQQKRSGRRLGRILVEGGMCSEEQISAAVARQLGVPHVNLKFYNLNNEIVRRLPESQARRFRAIVLEDRRTAYLVGMADPSDLFAQDELQRALKRPVQPAAVSDGQLLAAIDRIYRRTEEISGLAKELSQDLGDAYVDFGALGSSVGAEDAPVVRLLQTVFEDAVQANASDVHIEPQERNVHIRFRMDGVLQKQAEADTKIGPAIVLRLKLMAGLDISEKRHPQDGRFNVKVREQAVDVRLSTMPVQYGESVVMRLLSRKSGLLSLDGIGMPAAMLKRFREILQRSNGMALVTGPTGSGKTTTLYAALAGHLVLSTLHTKDAVTTPIRLIDMGAPYYMVGTSLHAVIAQRLVRLNCESCAEPYAPPAQELGWLAAQYGIRPGEHRFKRGRGCSHCNSVGLLGRTGIYEMLEMSPDMVAALNRNQTNEFMALAEKATGERSLKHHALQLALSGRSPVSEVIRVASELGD